MTYSDALDYLFSMLPMYQRLGNIAYKADLNNTIALLSALDNPQNDFKSVHIAGTNGKGTSAHAIAAILQLSGYNVGLYTSPHLKEYTERIKINGEEISKKWVSDFVEEIVPHIEAIKPSFFEVTVAMAFNYFSDQKVDIAIIETGLGGRLDSTNVIIPEVCLITNIGMDHMDILGNSIEKIAQEKAGIIKPGVPIVVGSDMVESACEVMKSMANQQGSLLTISKKGKANTGRSKIPYFDNNVPGILNVIGELRDQGWGISETYVLKGLDNFTGITGLKGRYQELRNSPLVIADVSHNADGIKILIDHIKSQKFDDLHIIYGTIKDKDLNPIFELLPKDAKYYFTQSSVPRSLEVNKLVKLANGFGIIGQGFQNVNEAKESALSVSDKGDLILITGSTFVVAEVT